LSQDHRNSDNQLSAPNLNASLHRISAILSNPYATATSKAKQKPPMRHNRPDVHSLEDIQQQMRLIFQQIVLIGCFELHTQIQQLDFRFRGKKILHRNFQQVHQRFFTAIQTISQIYQFQNHNLLIKLKNYNYFFYKHNKL
jgi:hypothetical protein